MSIGNDCSNLLVHIKKCKKAMLFHGYTDAGIVGYFIKLPFKKFIENISLKLRCIRKK